MESKTHIFQALLNTHSPDRFGTYLAHTSGDEERALRLYVYNTALSAAFYGPIQGLEVALRNALHKQLTIAHGEDWYNHAKGFLDDNANRKIDEARKQLVKDGHTIDPPHMVAALSFGFWVSLLGSGGFVSVDNKRADYETKLWRPYLRKAFPYASVIQRKSIHKPLDFLRTFRNRIAHHEPIFARALIDDYRSILSILGFICPNTASWVDRNSRVLMILRNGPDAIDHF